jgi:hypothetical protein
MYYSEEITKTKNIRKYIKIHNLEQIIYDNKNIIKDLKTLY